MEPAIIGVAEAKQGLIDEFNKWVGSPQGTFTLAQPEVGGRQPGWNTERLFDSLTVFLRCIVG